LPGSPGCLGPTAERLTAATDHREFEDHRAYEISDQTDSICRDHGLDCTMHPLIPLLLLALAVSIPAWGQDRGGLREYDAAGRPIGRAETRGSTLQRYDAAGRPTGRTEQSGSSFRNYDAAGAPTGRVERSSDTYRQYNAAGAPTGRVEQRGDTLYRYDPSGRPTGRDVIRGNTIQRYDPSGRPIGRDEWR
jgi:YD repeat-containing protein